MAKERLDGDEEREGYRGPQACKIVGITYRQLDYWARTGLVKPSLSPAKGSGSQRMYSFRDLVHLRLIKNLLDTGVSLPQIRKAIRYVADELNAPLEDVTLLSDGTSIYAATSDRDIVDLLRKGQGVFGIALGKVYEDLRGQVRKLLPAGKTEPAASSATADAGGS